MFAVPVSRLVQGRQPQHALQALVAEPRDDVADSHRTEATEAHQVVEASAAQHREAAHQWPTKS